MFIVLILFGLISVTVGDQHIIIRKTTEIDYAINLISDCGYPREVHKNVKTEDGYLLTMQRIRGKSKNSIPVLFMHGLLGSAEHFLLLNCTDALPYQLYNQGYDIWIGNVRTVSYSRHHVSLNPNGPAYWDISMDEFGNYDVPALIDYILKTTNHEQIMYVGHSQGNMIFYIMCHNRPEYANKVKLFVNLSPVATLNNFPHPWLGMIAPHVKALQSVVEKFGLYEWTFGRDYIREYGGMMCSMVPELCKYLQYLFSGLPPARLPNDQFQRLLTNCPEGIAAKQFIHACLMVNDQRFEKFNFGTPQKNLINYGSEIPPEYDLSRTTTPVAIYYCHNDWFLLDTEVERIMQYIPNIVDSYKITIDGFSHFDFIIGPLAPRYLYPRIIALMNHYRDMQPSQIEG